MRSLQKKHRPIGRIGVNDANFTGGHSEEGEGNSSLVNVSIFEEPSAVVPHARICEGTVRATGGSTSIET